MGHTHYKQLYLLALTNFNIIMHNVLNCLPSTCIFFRIGEELYKLHASVLILILLFQAVSTMFKPIRIKYCRFGNFRENFIFANSIKRHISDVKKSRLRQDLPILINNRVSLSFREGFIFTKLRICEVSRK